MTRPRSRSTCGATDEGPGAWIGPELPGPVEFARAVDGAAAESRTPWGRVCFRARLEPVLETVAVLSDVHGVLASLDAVLAEPDVVAADLVVVTGDHVWGPQPTEVLDRLTALGERAVLVRGNADREILQMSHGIDVGLADDPVSVWGAQELRPRHQALLQDMPEQVTLELAGFGPVRFCHATPRDDEEVVLVDSRIDRWRDVLAPLPPEVTTVVCGHTHMPFVRLVLGRTVVNAGSVGLPYGRSGAHWVLLRRGGIELRRTLVPEQDLFDGTCARSSMPGVADWLEEMVREPAGDAEVMALFGPRDGR